jgi:glycerol-3-phosphate dehydrogenase (NAD(P)+)
MQGGTRRVSDVKLRVAVIGGGSWGTTVGHLVAHNTDAILWARSADTATEVDQRHTNEKYLAGYELHPGLRATADLAEAVESADVLVLGVPSHAFRVTMEEVAPHVRAWVPVISLTKGLEQETGFRMTEVVQAVLPGHPYGVLTGPNLAKEILAGYAAASVIAMSERKMAEELQAVFASNLFRVYTNDDVVGCELGGALKNVIAIASGMADGLGAGDNTRAAVITRGLSEMSRLGVCLGGDPLTFSGLAGMGDLMATCISPQSRNRTVGEQLGKGKTIDEVIADMNQVAEGIKTSKVVRELAQGLGCEMPIVEQVYMACHEGRTAEEAYRGLLGRSQQREMHGLDGIE